MLFSHYLYVLYYCLHFNENLTVGKTHLFDIMMDCAVDFDVEPISKIVWKRKTTTKKWSEQLHSNLSCYCRAVSLRNWRDSWAGERWSRHIPSRASRGREWNLTRLFTNPLTASPLAFTASLPHTQKHSRARSRQLRRLPSSLSCFHLSFKSTFAFALVFSLLCHVIGLKSSRHFFIQSGPGCSKAG